MKKAYFVILALLFFLPKLTFADATPTQEALKALKEYNDTLKKPVKEKTISTLTKQKIKETHEQSIKSTAKEPSDIEMIKDKKVKQLQPKSEIENLIEAGRYSEVIKFLIPLIKKEPNNFELRYKLALAYFEYGLNNKAVEEFKMSSIFSPKNPDIHFRWGKIYVLQGDKNSAIEEYRQLKDINPEMAKNFFEINFPEGK